MPPPDHHALLPGSGTYRAIMVTALATSFVLWLICFRRERRMLAVYLGAILGGFTGAKVVFILSEGWLFWGDPRFIPVILSGKTIIGALLGGYAGVEIGKASVGFKGATGDWFALVVPLGIASGRIGCLASGCCRGIHIPGIGIWPAPLVEMGFNLFLFATLFFLRRIPQLNGQLFHIYLITYGLFRFAHEFVRETLKPFAGLSGYQIAALALTVFAAYRFWQRQKEFKGKIVQGSLQ